MAAALCPLLGFSQLGVTNLGETYSIDFDNAVTGVNSSKFQGLGFTPSGASGALNSNAFRYTGLSNAGPAPQSIAFGSGNTSSGESSRATSDGRSNNMSVGTAASKRGFYAFNTSTGIASADYALGWFSDGVALNPGEVFLKITNNTGGVLNVVRFSYDAKYLNVDIRNSSMNVTYSTNGGSSFSTISGNPLDITTPTSLPAGGASAATWQTIGKAAIISGLAIPNGGDIIIKWTSAYGSGSGGFADLLAIDNIAVRAYKADYLWDGAAWTPSEPSGPLTTSSVLVLPSGKATIAPASTSVLNLFIESKGKLEVTTDLTVAGKIFLYADDNGYAQVKGDIAGTAVYQTHRLATYGKWLNMAIPVDATYDDVTGMFIQTVAASANTNLWYYDAADPVSNTPDGTWKHITDKTTAQTEEAAYNLYGGDGTYFGSGPFDLEVEGPIVEAPVSLSVTGKTGGRFNYIPNPFASALDWQQARVSQTGVGATYYVQDGNPSLGDIVWRSWTWNMPSSGVAGGERQIPPGQGFYVLVDQTNGGTIDFTHAHQDVNFERDLYKTTATPGFLKFSSELVGTEYKDETSIYFESSYNDVYEFLNEGKKMMNSGYPNLYTKSSDNFDLVTNGMNDAWTTKDVDLYFQGDNAGNYRLSLDIDGLPAEWTVILEDKMLGNFTNIRKSGYGFTHAIGASADRFVVHFNKTGAVGLEELNGAVVFSYVNNNVLAVNLDDLNNVDITVFDMNGKQVANSGNQNGVVEFDMADWAKGVYMINVTANGKQVHSNKVVH